MIPGPDYNHPDTKYVRKQGCHTQKSENTHKNIFILKSAESKNIQLARVSSAPEAKFSNETTGNKVLVGVVSVDMTSRA